MNLTSQILNEPKKILKFLQIGISIPIWTEFHKYIIHDINYFQAKSILIKDDGNVVGHTLIYNENEEILYFGYFGVINHNRNYISFLLSQLLKYAKEKQFKSIRGPINLPTVIFGWGFMQEGSLESLFVGKPVNPPIYQNLFFQNGFYVKIEEKSWEGNYLRFNPYRLKQFDYSDYEYFNPNDWNDLMEYKEDFLRIHAENMPETAKITPGLEGLFDSYTDYLFNYGYNFMIMFIRYKPTGKIVACGSCLPNPFRKDAKGNTDSIVAYSWAINKEHRKKGLTLLMFGATSLQAWKKKLRYTTGPTGGEENIRFAKFADFVNLQNKRTHLILELKL